MNIDKWLVPTLSGDKEGMRREFPWAGEMAACPQDILYHAEGDVWTHTMMVYDNAVREADRFSGSEDLMRLAALFHDSAKPETTVHEWCSTENRQRVKQPHHAAKGGMKAWQTFVDAGFNIQLAREVVGICQWHQRPTHIAEQNHPNTRISRFVAEGGRWDLLLAFCASDQSGRISPNVEEGLLALMFLRDDIERLSDNLGHDLLSGQAPDSAEWRVRVGEAWSADPFYSPPDEDGPTLTVMSGLPGSGKTSERRRLVEESERPVVIVSLDDIRNEFGRYKRTQENEGRCFQEAQKRLRGALARKDDVIWDACCLDALSRSKILRIGRDYGSRTRVVSMDEPAEVAFGRNAVREHPVPADIMSHMASKREMVLATEAHEVWSVRDGVRLDVSRRPNAEGPAETPAP